MLVKEDDKVCGVGGTQRGKKRSNDSVGKLLHQLGSEMGSIAALKLQCMHTSVCPVLFEQKPVKLKTAVG